MADKQKVLELVFDALEEVNEQLPKKKRLEKSEQTVLLGPAGKLSSLALVNLIVLVEEKIEQEFGITVSFADEFSKSMESNIFRTPGTLVEHICTLLENS